MKPPRIVLDTNVLLSTLLFHAGPLSWLRLAWQSEAIHPLASHDTTTELIRVLSYLKFTLTSDEREDLLGDYLPWCETATVPSKIKLPDCRDPFDRAFLALTLTAKADALVTGEKDLLALSHSFAVPILAPAAFRDRMQPKAKK